MASLTPNEDKVRAMPKHPGVEAAKARTGRAGVQARVIGDMMDAYALAAARELDRGSSKAEILSAFADALGQIVGSLVAGSGTASPQLAEALLGQISLVGGLTLGAHEAGAAPTEWIGLTEVGRA